MKACYLILSLGLGSFTLSTADASTRYCDNGTPVNSSIEIIKSDLQRQPLHSGTEDSIAISHSEMKLKRPLKGDEPLISTVGFDWRYSIMDFQSVQTMTNGHLHRWAVPLSGQKSAPNSVFYYVLTPILSLSSNALKNPDLWSHDSLQLDSKAVFRLSFRNNAEWLIGFGSDHRFGDYHAYPVLGVCLHPDPYWNLQLAYPDFSIHHRASQGVHIRFYTNPVGAQWQVFSKDLSQHSEFIYQAHTVGLSLSWQAADSFSFTVAWEKQFNTEFEFVSDDLTRVETRSQDTNGWLISGRLEF